MTSEVDQDDSMIKYLREKITGRPAVFSRAGDVPIDENSLSLNKSDSQNSLIDIPSNDQTNSTNANQQSIISSSPIVIPRKTVRSNIDSSQSSSSYASIADPQPSLGESDDAANAMFQPLAFPCEQLEHSAARDRISVKNKRRQPIKQKLTTLRETDDDLFSSKIEVLSSTPDDEPITRVEPKAPQPLIDLSDLDNARARLSMSVRTRDRSADNILLSTSDTSSSNMLKLNNSMQRSMSFKRPQDLSKVGLINRINLQSKDDNMDHSSNQSISGTSSQEHIYDNLDVFKQTNQSQLSPIPIVKTRESTTTTTATTTRVRPVTMHSSASNDKQTISEFENVFNQLKRRASIRLPDEKKSSDNEPIIKHPPTSPQLNNRRKTMTGVHLPVNNKVGTGQIHPTPSWVDIAKQKQSKFQSISDDKQESEPTIIERKQTPTATDIRSNRKSMFESSTVSTNSPVPERDSIRALKAGNPNRINNLIQFFDK